MVVETFGLTKVYPGGGGCRDITLSIGEGEVFGLLGPNGAGKSTFIKMLVGLVFPSAGRARILGRPLGDLEARSGVGFLPEHFRYQEWLAAGEVLRFHGALAGLSASEVRERIPRVLDLVGLPGLERKKVGAFSKGMQQRLGLAVAVLSQPRLVLLDEPTSALDPVGRREVRQIIQRLRAEGVTVFLNSHLLSEVERVCDRVAVIKEGQLVAVGGLSELLNRGLEVEVEVDGVDEPLLAALRPLVKRLRHEGIRLIVEMEDREAVSLLARKVLESGHHLYTLQSRQTSLEEVFMEMMEGGGENA